MGIEPASKAWEGCNLGGMPPRGSIQRMTYSFDGNQYIAVTVAPNIMAFEIHD